MRRYKRFGWGIVLFCLMGFIGTAQAAVGSTQPATPDQVSGTRFQRYRASSVLDKFSRGVGNLVMGWLELPNTLQREYAPQDPATSMVRGAVLGLVKAVARTSVGVYETVTFWLPLPRDFHPILPPLDYDRPAPAKPSAGTSG